MYACLTKNKHEAAAQYSVQTKLATHRYGKISSSLLGDFLQTSAASELVI